MYIRTYVQATETDTHMYVCTYDQATETDTHIVRTYIRSGFGDRHTLCRHIAWYIAHTHKQTLSCFNWEHVCTRRFLICAIQANRSTSCPGQPTRTTPVQQSATQTTPHPIPPQYLWSTVELQLLHDTYTYLHTVELQLLHDTYTIPSYS